MPFLVINLDGKNLPVYSDTKKTTYLGYIAIKEIYVVNSSTSTYHQVQFYTGGKFIRGYVLNTAMTFLSDFPAFTEEFSYGGFNRWYEYGGQENGWGCRFNVAHKCRIFNGSTEVLSLYAGDFVIVDGSQSTNQHSYRLNIVGYSKGGRIVIQQSGLSCDTDIEIGWNQPHNTAVVGKW